MNSTTQKIADFFGSDKSVRAKKGELLLEPGREPSGVFYLKKGSVKMTAISANGNEVVINTFKTGAFFPIGWTLNNTPNLYYYQTAEECEIQKRSKDHLVDFLKANPDVVWDLMQRIYKGLDGYFMRMEYLMAGSAYSRLITEIVILAKRFGEKAEKGFRLKKIVESELAAQIGISRETVSREFKKLIDKELISYHKNQLQIKNITDLEKELQ